MKRTAARPKVIKLRGRASMKAAAGGPPRITILAYNGGPLPVEDFPFPVVLDAQGLEIPAQVRPILVDHDDSEEGVLGQTDAIDVDRRTGVITATGIALGESPKAIRVIKLATKDPPYEWQASVGTWIEEQELIPAGRTVEVNDRSFEGPLIVARKSYLREISFVPTGADDSTSARIAAAAAQETVMPTFEEWVASLGFDPLTLTDVQKEQLTALYQAMQTQPAEEPAETVIPEEDAVVANGVPPEEERLNANGEPVPEEEKVLTASMKRFRAQMAAETKRVALVQAKLKDQPTLQAKAIKEGWSADRIELESLRASRPKAPAGYSHTNDTTPRVLEAALCRATGLSGIEKQFNDRELSTADRLYGGSLGIQGFLLEAAARAGLHVGPARFTKMHEQVLRAAFSMADISGILSNVQNKHLLEGWKSGEDTWERIAGIGNATDFKEMSLYRLTSSGTWEEVGPTGELAHGTLGNDSYTNKVKTYGEIITINRQMQVNDDLNALSDLPRQLGRKAILTLNRVFWTKFLGSLSTLFPTDNAKLNYFEGAATNLQSSSLTTAVSMFRKQKDSENNPLGIAPKTLLVSPENEATADELYSSRWINTGGSSTKEKVPNDNTHSNKYKPAVSAYLSDSAFTGYSTTAWYLCADPMDLPLMHVAFLNGQRNPTVETEQADFGTLGIQTRAFSDFGVNTHEYRAGVRSKGAA